MDVLASRIILRPNDFETTLAFYRDRLGLGVFREYPGGVVFFAGQSLIEVAGHGEPIGAGGKAGGRSVNGGKAGGRSVNGGKAGGRSVNGGKAGGRSVNSSTILLQVRDVEGVHAELVAAGVDIVRPPRTEPWGLIEMWIADPDGTRIAVVEVPADHPQRRG